MKSTVSRLLAGASLLTLGGLPVTDTHATTTETSYRMAQASPSASQDGDKKDQRDRPQRAKPPSADAPKPPAASRQPSGQPGPARPAQTEPARPAPPAAQAPQTPRQPAAQDQPRRDQPVGRPAGRPAPAAQGQTPDRPAAPSTAGQPSPSTQGTPAARAPSDRRQQPAAAPNQPGQQQPSAQQQRQQPSGSQDARPGQADRRDNDRDRAEDRRDRRDDNRDRADDRRDRRDDRDRADDRRDRRDDNRDRADDRRDRRDDNRDRDRRDIGELPRAPRDARDFIRRGDGGPGRRIDDIRQDRREVREGDRTIIREGDRTIIREGNRTIIRHNEADRFAIGARNVRTERRGDQRVSIVERPNGVRVVTITDEDGHLIRRVRRDARGREVVLIDNAYRGPRRPSSFYVDIAPPVIRIPRERYIVEADDASPEVVYDVLTAAPVERVERRYTLDQIRYTQPLRDRMPRVDLDVTFDSGSWQITPEQVQKLAAIAEGLNRAIEKNPQEVFLIEGHTDAVGSDVDNLSLSDRRAETVAVALTEQLQVPAENLVTQGYGEQYLKVQTEADERANRRVAVRRVTPLLDQTAGNEGQR